MKRGQITLFVAVGIVIMVVIGLGLYYSKTLSKKNFEVLEQDVAKTIQNEKDLNNYVTACLTKTLKESLLEISRNGGYYPPKKGSINSHVPVYYDSGKEDVPSKHAIEGSIKRYVDRNIVGCLDEFDIGTIDTKIEINKNVRAELNMPVSYKNIKLDKFYTQQDYDYDLVLNSVKEFYDVVKKFNDTIDLGDLGSLDMKYAFMYNYTNNATVYTLNFLYFGDTLSYKFATRKKIQFNEFNETIFEIDESEELTEPEVVNEVQDSPEQINNEVKEFETL
ncbi:hypothetical protein D6777_03340 [Candidatus Woesearchaeota archaeon]|nr:MAG: hypothetical protein D6777_03340 [Candidatus Woesearchaeota archaeon]